MSVPNPVIRSAVGAVLTTTRGHESQTETPTDPDTTIVYSPEELAARSNRERGRAGALLVDLQLALNDYLDSKDRLDSLDAIAGALNSLRDQFDHWHAEFKDSASKDQTDKVELLEDKLTIEIGLFDAVRDHTEAMDELLRKLETATEPEEKERLAQALELMVETFDG